MKRTSPLGLVFVFRTLLDVFVLREFVAEDRADFGSVFSRKCKHSAMADPRIFLKARAYSSFDSGVYFGFGECERVETFVISRDHEKLPVAEKRDIRPVDPEEPEMRSDFG